MKITAYSGLVGLLCEAIAQFNKAKGIYEKAEHDFFNNKGDADAFRTAKQDNDTAMWRVIELETAKRVIDELENRGVEV